MIAERFPKVMRVLTEADQRCAAGNAAEKHATPTRRTWEPLTDTPCTHEQAGDETWWCPTCGEFLEHNRGPTDRADD
jgi:hypothetical protein